MTMHLRLEINQDYVRFEGSSKILRPMHVSRCRWIAFWQHFTVRGVTKATLAEAMQIVRMSIVE
jgi:hypothetical protein